MSETVKKETPEPLPVEMWAIQTANGLVPPIDESGDPFLAFRCEADAQVSADYHREECEVEDAAPVLLFSKAKDDGHHDLISAVQSFLFINAKNGYEFDSNEPEVYQSLVAALAKATRKDAANG